MATTAPTASPPPATSSSSLTQRLGALVSSMRYADLPAAAIAAIKGGAADYIGVTLAARHEPVLALAESVLAPPKDAQAGEAGEATVIVNGHRTSSANAALLNAAAAHALDYDDTGLDGHPSVVLLSVALAEAERLGADGRRMIGAYAAGFEVWARLTALEEDKIHTKGWHPSSTFGALAAAATAANLAQLSPAGASRALAIAASMAAGVVANFGSMMKPLQVGFAASHGITATRLAAAGLTASGDALENPVGLLAALSPAGRVRSSDDAASDPPPGQALLTYGINIKRYPMCYAMHRALDALVQLCMDHQVLADEVRSIDFTIGRAQASMLHQHEPQDVLGAKFSLEFGAACVILNGARSGRCTVGLADLTPQRLASIPVRNLMARVHIATDEARDPDEPLFSPADRVSLTLANGGVLRSDPVRRALGHAQRPLDAAALYAKFDDCCASAIPLAIHRQALFAQLAELESIRNPADLFAILNQSQ